MFQAKTSEDVVGTEALSETEARHFTRNDVFSDAIRKHRYPQVLYEKQISLHQQFY